jgi:hypothetical protein
MGPVAEGHAGVRLNAVADHEILGHARIGRGLGHDEGPLGAHDELAERFAARRGPADRELGRQPVPRAEELDSPHDDAHQRDGRAGLLGRLADARVQHLVGRLIKDGAVQCVQALGIVELSHQQCSRLEDADLLYLYCIL